MRYDVYREARLMLINVQLEEISKVLNITLEDAKRYARSGCVFHSVYQIQLAKSKTTKTNSLIPMYLKQEWDEVVKCFKNQKKSAISNS